MIVHGGLPPGTDLAVTALTLALGAALWPATESNDSEGPPVADDPSESNGCSVSPYDP